MSIWGYIRSRYRAIDSYWHPWNEEHILSSELLIEWRIIRSKRLYLIHCTKQSETYSSNPALSKARCHHVTISRLCPSAIYLACQKRKFRYTGYCCREKNAIPAPSSTKKPFHLWNLVIQANFCLCLAFGFHSSSRISPRTSNHGENAVAWKREKKTWRYLQEGYRKKKSRVRVPI